MQVLQAEDIIALDVYLINSRCGRISGPVITAPPFGEMVVTGAVVAAAAWWWWWVGYGGW